MIHAEFARFAGEMAEALSLNRSIGQIYGALYIHSGPLSLDEIAEGLQMSKGNASVNLRVLERWGAVRRASRTGTRKDYYEADRDVKKIALRRVREGFSHRLDYAQENIERFLARSEKSGPADETRKRLRGLHALVVSSRRALDTLPTIFRLLP